MLRKQTKIEKIAKVLGRTEKLPKKLVGMHFKIPKKKHVDSKELLLKAGYKNKEGYTGYVRYFQKDYRYHADILSPNKIAIHTDHINNVNRHRASLYKVQEEWERICTFLPQYMLSVEEQKRLTAQLNNVPIRKES